MKANAQTKTAILNTLKRMWDMYALKDVDKIMSFYLPGPDLFVLGSGPDEKYIGPKRARAGLKRDFKQASQTKVTLANVHVSAAGRVAWLASDCTFYAKVNSQRISMTGRLTCVFEKRGKRWLIAQSHFSMPYTEQAPGQSFPIK